jgi:spermidine synthase
MLSLVLGATTSASTIVLVAFMAGFGIGAFYWGEKSDTVNKPVKMLAFLLIAIGISSMLNYFLIKTIFPSVYSLMGSIGITDFLVYFLSAFSLMASTFFMGGILPIVSKMLILSNDQISSGIGRIYAFETLGSTIGGILAGFLFLGKIGQQNTIILAVVINLLLAAYLLVKGNYVYKKEIVKDSIEKVTKIKKGEMGTNRLIAMVSTIIFGFSILGLQIIWIRIFKIYLTNTSYTFALIASLVILGLFTGSWLFKKWNHKFNDLRILMFKIFILFGIVCAIGFVVLVKMPELIMFPFKSLLGNPFIKLLLMPMIASLLVVFPPTALSGFAFPLACKLYTSSSTNIGKNVGIVLSFNTIGTIFGPLVATFILIPLIGAALSVLLFLIIGLMGALFIVFKLQNKSLAKFVLIGIIAILLITIIIKPQVQILPPSFSNTDKEVIFYKETVEASLVVSKEKNNKSEVKTTYVNNAVVIGSTYDAIKAVKMIGHLPFFAGLDCKEVLVVGFGIGVTTSTIASHPEVKSIDCIELAAGLKEAAKYYSDVNNNIINDPRLKFIQGDGRHFLQRTSKKYDLISSDPTHPILGSSNLYSKEYFELCNNHLNKGGMVSQYLPLHKLRPQDFQGIIKTFGDVFAHASVWLGHTHAILVGSNEPLLINFNEWEKNIAKTGKDRVFYSNPYHLAAGMMLSPEGIKNIDEEIEINTDDRSYLEFFSPACLDLNNLNENISFLSNQRSEIYDVFNYVPDAHQMKNFVSGSQHFIKSVISFQNGNRQKSLDELREAVRINPENQEYPFLIKFYYNVQR